MDSKSNKDEYHSPDEEFETDYPEDQDAPEEMADAAFERPFSVKGLLLSKKVFIPLAIIVAIYGLYWFMEMRDRRQQTVTEEVAPQTQEPVRQPPPPPVAVVPLPRQQPPTLDDDLKMVLEQSNRNEVQLDTLTSELDQIQAVQSQMNAELASLHDAIMNLTQQIEGLKTRRVMRKRVRRSTKPAPVYHVKALVPGRAWLQNKQGKTFTVKVGERVRGYGVVQSINVTTGIVRTSSGREITYGKYDS